MLNAKFSEFGTRLISLEEKLNSATKDINLKLNLIETTAQETGTQAPENREEIEGLKFRLAVVNYTVSNQASALYQLDIEVEDLKNSSLRKTLDFKKTLKNINLRRHDGMTQKWC